jgi:outer membrane receptor protein involved in Fe transport
VVGKVEVGFSPDRSLVIRLVFFVMILLVPTAALAQDPQPPLLPNDATTFTVTVIGTTPLPGVEMPLSEVPTPVQTATSRDIDGSGAVAISDFLNRRMTSVFVNEIQNNPFQPDVNYRGYTASPLLGTPQGLSVYMDGVRMNQPFGEVVSWDLIPRLAIASTTLIPGSNPVFGLNTLGGALSLQTKTGRSAPGTTVEATYGSNTRRMVEFEHGGERSSAGLQWYVAGSLFGDDGWRDDSGSDVRQIFGKIGWRDLTVSAAHANNSLTGNGLQDVQLLATDRAGVYTKPDTTDNRSTLLNVAFAHAIRPTLTLNAHGYFRDIRTNTINGDINEDSLDQSVYQPNAAERAALAAAGYTGVPASGLDAGNTPFPSLRCIGNALLGDDPAETCNGLINRTQSRQHNAGASVQATRRDVVAAGVNVFTAGGAVDHSATSFGQASELGYLNPDRSVTGVGAFGDGVTGGSVDGVPFDTRVDLDGTITTWSIYATDTLPLGSRAHLTLSGRYDRSSIDNRDRIHPDDSVESLSGDHLFQRFNPAAGVTVAVSRALGVYANFGAASRAPTAIELGCANPDQPCKLPNAMAGDPPLDEVITRTVEGGVRGTIGRVNWNAGMFRSTNHDDILFVTSEQSGFGYFRNVDDTRRQGIELGIQGRFSRLTAGAGYTYLRATFASAETLNGESNSTNDEGRGLDGTIDVEPGDRLPLTPAHVFKAYGDLQVTRRVTLDVDLLAVGSSYARGNEDNGHEPDGVYYLGGGTSGAYAVVNLGARVRVNSWLDAVGQIDNVFDADYATAAQLGPTGLTAAGTFVARPLPAVNGEFPVRQTTFLAPGAPTRGWIGARVHF